MGTRFAAFEACTSPSLGLRLGRHRRVVGAGNLQPLTFADVHRINGSSRAQGATRGIQQTVHNSHNLTEQVGRWNNRSSPVPRLGRFLDGCAALDRDVELLLRDGWNTSVSPSCHHRGVLPSGARTRHQPARTYGAGHHGTALALVRLHFETTVRAAWVQIGATEDWLNKFTEPVPAGSMKEPSLGPPIPSMLDAIEARAHGT